MQTLKKSVCDFVPCYSTVNDYFEQWIVDVCYLLIYRTIRMTAGVVECCDLFLSGHCCHRSRPTMEPCAGRHCDWIDSGGDRTHPHRTQPCQQCANNNSLTLAVADPLHGWMAPIMCVDWIRSSSLSFFHCRVHCPVPSTSPIPPFTYSLVLTILTIIMVIIIVTIHQHQSLQPYQVGNYF